MTLNAETGSPPGNPAPQTSAKPTEPSQFTPGSTVRRVTPIERATRRVARARLELDYAIQELEELVRAEVGESTGGD